MSRAAPSLRHSATTVPEAPASNHSVSPVTSLALRWADAAAKWGRIEKTLDNMQRVTARLHAIRPVLLQHAAMAAPHIPLGRSCIYTVQWGTCGETFTFVTNRGGDSKLDLCIVGRASACLVYPECAFQGQLCKPVVLPIRVGPFVTDVYCSGEARESADLIVVRLDRKAFEAEWDAQCADGGSVGIAAKNQDFDAWLQSLPSIAAPMPLSEASEVEVLVGQGAAAPVSGHHPRLADEAHHKECTATPSSSVLKYVLHHDSVDRTSVGSLLFMARDGEVDTHKPIGVHGGVGALHATCVLLHDWQPRAPRRLLLPFEAVRSSLSLTWIDGALDTQVSPCDPVANGLATVFESAALGLCFVFVAPLDMNWLRMSFPGDWVHSRSVPSPTRAAAPRAVPAVEEL